MQHRLLLAMKDASRTAQYAPFLESRGMAVRCVYSGRDLLNTLRRERADVILLDMTLPDGEAGWFIERFASHDFHGPVLITVTPGQDRHDSIQTLHRKPALLTRPFSLSRLHDALIGLISAPHNKLQGQPETLPETLAGDVANDQKQNRKTTPKTQKNNPPISAAHGFGHFIGTSPVMQGLYAQIQSAALSLATVFITGESGTGKENCAQAIHKHSPAANKPFIPLNCAAIPRDLLESELFGHVRGAFTGAISDRDGAAKRADGGTLFLDEIGEMDPLMQTKLLRFLQDGSFQPVGASRLERSNARIICATNRDPMAAMRSGVLREDLFYRLHVLPIVMPPLRVRGDDVLDIAQTLLLRFSAEEKKRFKSFANDAEDVLRSYAWPGNIRQLQNIIRHAVVMNDALVLTAKMLPVHLLHGSRLPQDNSPEHTESAGISLGQIDGSINPQTPIQPLHVTEREAIEQALRHCDNNIPRAAALLEVSPSTLYRKKAQWDQMQ